MPRKFRLQWWEVEGMLRRAKLLLDYEGIKDITLVKPRAVLFHIENRNTYTSRKED